MKACIFDYNNINYKEWKGPLVSGRHAWAVSERVPDNVYWIILYGSLFPLPSSFNTTQKYAIHLVPPDKRALLDNLDGTVDNAFFQGALNSPPTQQSLRISTNDANSQSLGAVQIPLVIGGVGRIIVPPKWSVLAWGEDAAAASATSHQLAMRLAFIAQSINAEAPVFP